MKHLTPFKLFENMDNEDYSSEVISLRDILEIKDIFQDIADEWDIYWVDESDWNGMMSSLFKNKDYFVYTIREIVGNKDWQYLIDIVLPQNKNHKVWKNFKKFRGDLEICKDRLVHIGFKSSMILNDELNYQIAIN